MSFRRLIGRIAAVITVTLKAESAKAFDPFTIASGVSAVVDVASKAAERVDDVAELGFTFSGLLDDLEIEHSGEDQLKAQASKVQELESTLHEAHANVSDFTDSSNTLSESESLRTKLEAIRTMIRTTKALARLMPTHSKASEKALEIQQTRLSYMILDEMAAQRREVLGARMREQIRDNRLRLLGASIQKEEEHSK